MKAKTMCWALFISLPFSQTAPNFTSIDVRGNPHTLYDYTSRGKYVLIEWFHIHCGACPAGVPHLNNYYETYGCNTGGLIELAIDGLSYTGDSVDIAGWVETYDVSYPTISGVEGGGGVLSDRYGISKYPTYIWITPGNSMVEFNHLDTVAELITASGIQPSSCNDSGIYKITVNGGRGSGMFATGMQTTISTYTPDNEYFVKWTGDTQYLESAALAPAKLTMPDKDIYVSAEYKFPTEGIYMLEGRGYAVAVHDTMFYDDGGPSGPYRGDFIGTVTFTPKTPGKKIQIDFLAFSTRSIQQGEITDYLTIYDGNSIMSPIVKISHGLPGPFSITSSALDGSLTCLWKSRNEVVHDGWEARVYETPEGQVGAHSFPLQKPVAKPLPLIMNLDTQGGLSWKMTHAGIYHVSLFTIEGNLVHKRSMAMKKGINSVPLSAGRLPQGLLLMKLEPVLHR